jgi:hypothetical protein
LKGYIYIASAFETVNRSVCGRKGSWVDNDPHFWTNPPTWGICRNDLRAGAEIGDYVFFVLPRRGRHPQMIFAYLKLTTSCPTISIPKEWEGRGETIIRTISRRCTGCVMETRDRAEAEKSTRGKD